MSHTYEAGCPTGILVTTSSSRSSSQDSAFSVAGAGRPNTSTTSSAGTISSVQRPVNLYVKMPAGGMSASSQSMNNTQWGMGGASGGGQSSKWQESNKTRESSTQTVPWSQIKDNVTRHSKGYVKLSEDESKDKKKKSLFPWKKSD